ncbi:MAG: hypothetical protein MJK14_25740, partial [Rivularia sp. ALOHA_DT_140]|nr:hypothetical protein [Rivularia sp. ALOHA_DT_140]
SISALSKKRLSKGPSMCENSVGSSARLSSGGRKFGLGVKLAVQYSKKVKNIAANNRRLHAPKLDLDVT